MIERMFVLDGSGPIGQMREGLSGLRAVDRSGWSNAALSAEVLELAEVVERAQAEMVRLVGDWNARAAWADDGALSGPSWLTARVPTTRPAAARLLRSARLVHDHEQAAKALDVGDVTVAHVESLAAVAHGRATLYAEHEDVLLTAAGSVVPTTSSPLRVGGAPSPTTSSPGSTRPPRSTSDTSRCRPPWAVARSRASSIPRRRQR